MGKLSIAMPPKHIAFLKKKNGQGFSEGFFIMTIIKKLSLFKIHI